MNEEQRDTYRALLDTQRKYTYFLLAAAGAAVAFSLNQTQGAGIDWSQIPLAAALVCWGLSFLSGCRYVHYLGSTLHAACVRFQVMSGQHPGCEVHPQKMQVALEGISRAIESNSEIANRIGRRQFRWFVCGGLFYIGWHVLEMALRVGTSPAAPS